IGNNICCQLLSVGFPDDTIETGSVGSVGSRGGHSPATFRRHTPSDSILRHAILKAVSAHDTMDAGQPSVVCVGRSVIGVGTSHGMVMCFDGGQRARWMHRGDRDQGSVSCIASNPDSSRLLAGYARGLVLMFDTLDGKLLRTIGTEAHTPSTAVVHLRFTDLPSIALLSDSGGSVFELGLKRVLGVRSWEVRCVFSGSRGEVVTIEPLLHSDHPSHPLAGSVIVAMATLSKLLLISLRPETRLLFTFSTPSSPTSLPLLSWQFVVINVADATRVMDPVLAFARDDVIHFFQVSVDAMGQMAVHTLQKMTVGYSLVACHWQTSRTVALVDSTETLRLVDVRTKQELETLDLSCVSLVYNSSAFKGIATGGNVSKAMAMAGQRACYNSVQSFGSQLFLLGTKNLHSISIRIWTERIDNLISQNRFADALRLAMDFYEEKAKAVLGLRGPKMQRQKLVKEKVLSTLVTYIEKILDGSENINYLEAIPLIIDHCLDLEQRDLLFNKLWQGLTYDDEARIIYLEAIELAILDGRISELPPEIMQQLVTLQQLNYRWKTMEDCVLRVDVTCLDIEQVITTCKQQGLYNALISVWNRAMGDYTSPLFELIPILQTHIISEGTVDDEGRNLGNLLLVYIASSLGGQQGNTPTSQHVPKSHTKSCMKRNMLPLLKISLFVFRTLLEFDTHEFLNALAIAFSDSALTLQMRQRLVDILIQVMTEGETFKCTQIAWLLCVLNSDSVGRGLRIDPQLVETALQRTVKENDIPRSEREEALLNLMGARALADFPNEQLLEMAEEAEFYQVCAVIHELNGDHGKVLKCYLMDSIQRKQVFFYIEHSPHKDLIGRAIPENFKGLIETDPVKTGQIMVRHFPNIVQEVIDQISDNDLFMFLHGMFEESDLDSELMTSYICLMCQYDPEKVLSVVKAHDNIELDSAIKISKEYNLDEVTAVLLERSGDYQGAFDVLLAKLETLVYFKGKNVDSQTEELVSLAQRGSSVLDSKTSWLPLLTLLLKLNAHELLQRVLSNADLNLSSELHLLMQHTQGTLGDLRSLIMGLFVKCRHERGMQEAIKKLHMVDLHNEVASVMVQARRGLEAPTSCRLCHSTFTDRLHLFW
ncbi:hypothetical protein AAG570_010061, partial [Ranatra chinensis]